MNTSLQERFESLNREIAQACEHVGRDPSEIKLIVITKNHPAEVVQSVLDCGYHDIGENRVQEIMDKAPQLTGMKTIHLVGHLQTNKINKVIPLVDWIHSIDSERLAQKLSQQCSIIGKSIHVLVQVNTSSEDSKSGCNHDEAVALCCAVSKLPHLQFHGLMTIGLLGGSQEQTRECFKLLHSIGEQCKQYCAYPFELSMGMTDDFRLAIEEGSTIIRIGSYLLGERNY